LTAQSKQTLLEFLHSIDRLASPELGMTLVAVGDTAMALLGLKPPTAHLDFLGTSKDIAELERICTKVHSRDFQVHTWTDGTIFGNQLPDDYLKSSMPAGAGLARIDLRALHPLDIVVTKIERLSDSDMRDIRLCIRNFKLGKSQVSKRAKALQKVGDESRFERNLDYVMGLFA
jgi:hypothetical protein